MFEAIIYEYRKKPVSSGTVLKGIEDAKAWCEEHAHYDDSNYVILSNGVVVANGLVEDIRET